MILSQYNKAIPVLEEALKEYSDPRYNSHSLHLLGCAYMEKGSYNKAEQAYKKVIEEYPQSPIVNASRSKLSELEKIRSEATRTPTE